MPWLKTKKNPATATSNRAITSINPKSLLLNLPERLKNLTIGIKAQKPVSRDRIAEHLETLIDLRRLELLISFEDKGELREHMDQAATELGIDLNAEQQVVLLRTLIDQRRKRLDGQAVELKKSDFLAS